MNDEQQQYGSGDLTPAAIRSMTFTNRPDGYAKHEVDEFLEQVASAMEVLSSSTVGEAMRKEIQRHADISARVVLAAQDSAERLRAQAAEDAQDIIEDTKQLAEELRERGKNETRRAQQHVEELRQAFVDELRDMYDRIGSALYRFEAARKSLADNEAASEVSMAEAIEAAVTPAAEELDPLVAAALAEPVGALIEEDEPVVDLRGIQGFDDTIDEVMNPEPEVAAPTVEEVEPEDAPAPIVDQAAAIEASTAFEEGGISPAAGEPDAAIEASVWTQQPPAAEAVEWQSPAEIEAAAAGWDPAQDVAASTPEPDLAAAHTDPEEGMLGRPSATDLTEGGWLADTTQVDGTTIRTGPYVTVAGGDEDEPPLMQATVDALADDVQAEALLASDSMLPPPPTLSTEPISPPQTEAPPQAQAAATPGLTDLDLQTARQFVLNELAGGAPREAIETYLQTIGIADANAFVEQALTSG